MKPLHAERGAALVELAVALPLLVLILVGTADFARVFYTSIELNNAVRAAVQYGTATAGNSGDTAGMISQALAASPDINSPSPISVSTPVRSCWCATDDGSAFAPQTCTTVCAGTGTHLVASVTVTASKTFTTISPFPGIPHVLTISRSATMRVR